MISPFKKLSFLFILVFLVLGTIACEETSTEEDPGPGPSISGADLDGDGFCENKSECEDGSLPGDCNNEDANIHPDADEICDSVDNNCNDEVDEDLDCSNPDSDDDGFNNKASGGEDCNDTDPDIHPDALEVCDTVDNNCDGTINEGLICFDADNDGFEDESQGGLDCDDTNPAIHPDANEICDEIDNNCDGAVDEFLNCFDQDNDGFDSEASGGVDCNDNNPLIHPDADEACDGQDNNCDGIVDEGFDDLDADGLADCVDSVIDVDGDGFGNTADCDDTNSAINPNAAETCDGVDNNCDDQIDEGFADLDGDGTANCVDEDKDGDGYCVDDVECQDHTLLPGDCKPNNGDIHPGVTELCDGIDNNCDDQIDEGFEDLDEDGIADCVDDEVILPTPEISSFTMSQDCVVPGSTVTLNWETTDAEEVYLDDVLVGSSGATLVSFSSDTTYTLRAVYRDEEVTQDISGYVKERILVNEAIEEDLGNAFGDGEIDDIQASDDGTLLSLSEGEIFKGEIGENFTRLNPNSNVSEWKAVAIDPEDSSLLYGGTDGRVYGSKNGGSSWPDIYPLRVSGSDVELNTIYVSPVDPDIVYFGFDGGAFKYDASKKSLDLMTGLNAEDIRHFVEDEDKLVASSRSSIFVSSNGGNSWNDKGDMGGGKIHSLDIYDGTLYVSAKEGLYQVETSDLGVSNPNWDKMGALDGPVYQALVRSEWVGKSIGDVVYAATKNGVYKNTNSSWKEYNTDGSYEWLLEDIDGGLIAVSDSSLNSFQSTFQYSDTCPGQPFQFQSYTSIPILFSFPVIFSSPVISTVPVISITPVITSTPVISSTRVISSTPLILSNR